MKNTNDLKFQTHLEELRKVRGNVEIEYVQDPNIYVNHLDEDDVDNLVMDMVMNMEIDVDDSGYTYAEYLLREHGIEEPVTEETWDKYKDLIPHPEY